MKTRKFNYPYKTFMFFILFLITFSTYSLAQETTISRSAKLGAGDVVEVRSSNFDVTIQTWDKNELAVSYDLSVEAKTDDERNEFLKAFASSVDDNLKRSKASDPFSSINRNNGKVIVKFRWGGGEYHLTELKGTVTVRMPRHNALNAFSTFHKLAVDDLDADATITVNSGNLKMGTSKKLDLHSSFSRDMTIGDVDQAKITVNSGSIKMGNVKTDLSLKGSFSDFEVGKIGSSASVEINSSSFKSTDIGDLALSGSFIRSFVIQNVENASININSSNFKAAGINSLVVGKTSFSTYHIDELGNMTIGNSASSKFYIGQLSSLEASKCSFSNFDIDQLKTRFVAKSSSGSINIKQVLAGFDEIKIDGQFVTTNIHVADDCNYKLSADLNFPKYSFSNITYENHEKEMSHETMTGWHGNKEKATSKIGFKCQSCSLKLE